MIASAIVAGCVSLISMSMSATAEPAAESTADNECLATPRAATPAGAHWYYRVEKGTKRKCWYLADAKVTKPAAAAETTTAPVAEQDAPPPPNKPMRNSVANARAELTTGAPDEDQALSESTWPPLTPADQAAAREDNQAAAIQPAPESANAQGWNIASRWPEPKTTESAGEQPAADPALPAPALTPDRLAAAAATPAPAATPTAAAQPMHAVAAADPADTERISIRVLLSVLVCVLALAAIIGPMIFKYIRPRRKDERAYAQRRPIWDMNTSGEIVRQDNPRTTPPAPYADAPPEPRVLDEAVDELENLLVRASRRTAA
jgi:hypothetical protein